VAKKEKTGGGGKIGIRREGHGRDRNATIRHMRLSIRSGVQTDERPRGHWKKVNELSRID